MTQLWTIAAKAGGAVLAPCFATPSYGSHPKDNGWPWDAIAQAATRIAAAPDLAVQSWSGSAWVEDPAKVEAILVAAVKAEAERRKMLVRSPGSGKGAEYRRKRDEATASATVLAAVLNALTKPAALQQYPAAAMEAQLTGESLATVLTRYREASAAADTEVLRLAAVEWAGTKAIKAAATAAAKRAAATAISWTWQPAG
jgi:hypothetical protein